MPDGPRFAALLAESLKVLFKRNRPALDVHGIPATMLLLIANHRFIFPDRFREPPHVHVKKKDKNTSSRGTDRSIRRPGQGGDEKRRHLAKPENPRSVGRRGSLPFRQWPHGKNA
ncbi:hypothetical protein AGR13a_Cc330011 [Agrobacterium genomosp. 13 str. CFBP 6927]|uniref:Transposase n=1 Tax=Agrobacterium genomosp. 13 str. CFBP 6927 TaxID=1183428 RepID=A0ABM9VGH3_9HYPH|nr:hypothetical protein AGR13a_Cc330011 [Agrobacterium genomosp. 13 str. CFBP 6927]